VVEDALSIQKGVNEPVAVHIFVVEMTSRVLTKCEFGLVCAESCKNSRRYSATGTGGPNSQLTQNDFSYELECSYRADAGQSVKLCNRAVSYALSMEHFFQTMFVK
jgi:hypothetical protein